MTPSEMEKAIRNLQLQTNRIEQFLPTLATRSELYAVHDALRVEIQDARRHAVILNEATRDEIKLVAENLARVEATMATKEDLGAAIGGLQQTIGAPLAELATQIAALAKRRK